MKPVAIIDCDPGRGEPPNAQVAVAVNSDRFWELFLDVLATYP